MKNLILIFFFFPLGFVFSQNNDSIPEKIIGNIFGCECCSDPIVQKAGKNNQYECVLYKSQQILTGSKKGKIIWKIDLKKALENEDLTYLCLQHGRGKNDENLPITTASHFVMYISAKNGKEVFHFKK